MNLKAERKRRGSDLDSTSGTDKDKDLKHLFLSGHVHDTVKERAETAGHEQNNRAPNVPSQPLVPPAPYPPCGAFSRSIFTRCRDCGWTTLLSS